MTYCRYPDVLTCPVWQATSGTKVGFTQHTRYPIPVVFGCTVRSLRKGQQADRQQGPNEQKNRKSAIYAGGDERGAFWCSSRRPCATPPKVSDDTTSPEPTVSPRVGRKRESLPCVPLGCGTGPNISSRPAAAQIARRGQIALKTD